MQNTLSPKATPEAWSTRAAREVKENGRMSFQTYFVLKTAGIDVGALELKGVLNADYAFA